MRIQPNEDFHIGDYSNKLNKNCVYKAELATNQPDYIERGKVFVRGILLDKDDYQIVGLLNVELLEKELPHGSGIDCKWEIEDKGKYFKCHNSFHCMDENGYYCGYAAFDLIIPKKNPLNFRLHFIDKFGDNSQYLNQRYQLRDYLEDTFNYAISEMIKPIKPLVNEYRYNKLHYKTIHLLSEFLDSVIPYNSKEKAYMPIQFGAKSHIGSYLQVISIDKNNGRSIKSFETIPSDKMIMFIKDNMIAIDYDSIYFELYLYPDKTAMLITKYNQIIGSHWVISMIDMDSIPGICKE